MAWQQIITGTAAELSAANPVLELNQLAVVTEVVNNVSTAARDAKLGDGVTRYNDLPYWPPGIDGDVQGPASATDNAIARFDSTTGKVIQNSTITVSDTGTVAAASGTLTLTSPTLTTPVLGVPSSGTLGACIGGSLVSYLASTVTYNNTVTLANTPLSVTVAAGGIYAIELVVHSTSAVKALNMDFGGTATIANFIGEWHSQEATGIPSFNDWLAVSAAGTDYSNPDIDGNTGYYTFTGSVEITDAGTFLLRGAQNVSDASDTTILRGSTLTLTRMA